jgi:hypothetical protein
MAYFLQPITKTAGFTLDRDVHAGAVIYFDEADGGTIVLPASDGTGSVFTVFVGTTVTSDLIIEVANATDVINGGVNVSTDAAGVSILAAATDDTITLNGSTTGGLQGSWVKLTDVAAGFWMCEGFLVSSSSEATPFSAAVS